MEESVTMDSPPVAPAAPTRFKVLGAISFSHFLNDMMQSLLTQVGAWYKRQHLDRSAGSKRRPAASGLVSARRVAWSIGILVVLIFSKYFYIASISSYYSFYLIEKFHLSVQSSQIYLFVFLFAMALGTLVGGPVVDRIGRKRVIRFSILGVAPFPDIEHRGRRR